jgi:uncharacterized protein YecT (DUF1311 family)
MKRILQWSNGAPPTDAHYRRRRAEIKRNVHASKRKEALDALRRAWIQYQKENGGTYASQRKGK